MFDTGDIVARRSYNEDLLLRITAIDVERGVRMAKLAGLTYRLGADADVEDLVLKDERQITYYQLADSREIYRKLNRVLWARKQRKQSEYFDLPTRVLHLDGDMDYLEQCLKTYRQLGIHAKGVCRPEPEHAEVLEKALKENDIDVLVLTGHDALLKSPGDPLDLSSYRSSNYFVQAVRQARRVQPDRDQLIIFAGGCQSYFEEIISAGANFASSPKRMFIHALDPVFIVESITHTPVNNIVSLEKMLENTVTGTDGVGGIETRGKRRRGYPWTDYSFLP